MRTRIVLLVLPLALAACGGTSGEEGADVAPDLAGEGAIADDGDAVDLLAEGDEATPTPNDVVEVLADTPQVEEVTDLSESGEEAAEVAEPLDAEPAEAAGSDDVEIEEDVAPEEVTPPPLVEVPLTTLADGFHKPLVRPVGGQPFSLISASDPQLWWNFIDGDQEGVSDLVIEEQNQLHIDAMNALIAGEGLPQGAPAPIAVVMNGDLTEYGRWSQWDAYYRLYQGVEAPIFDGLGNHDYENNNEHVSNGCGMDVAEWQPWRKACDAGSTQTLWGQTACEVADSIKELWSWCATDTMRRMRYWLETHASELTSFDLGSISYSWEIGDFHFVQLHDYPGYEVPETQICDGTPWLLADLQDAVARDKWIVLLMHRPTQSALRPHLVPFRHRVVGIFFGHIHQRVGYTGTFAVEDVAIPEFYSGSVQWNLFSLASFYPDQLTVTSVDSNTGAPVHHDTAAAYDNVGAGATVAAPFTYVFPVIACPPGQVPTGAEGACEEPQIELPAIELCY